MRLASRGALALLAGAVLLAGLRPKGYALRVLRISRVVADLDRAEAFYRDGLGFERVERGPGDPALAGLLGIAGASSEQAVMRLGTEEIALVRFDPAGAPYPTGSHSDDLWFQHLAIVVDDMDAAFRRIQALSPQPISTDGLSGCLPATAASSRSSSATPTAIRWNCCSFRRARAARFGRSAPRNMPGPPRGHASASTTARWRWP